MEGQEWLVPARDRLAKTATGASRVSSEQKWAQFWFGAHTSQKRTGCCAVYSPTEQRQRRILFRSTHFLSTNQPVFFLCPLPLSMFLSFTYPHVLRISSFILALAPSFIKGLPPSVCFQRVLTLIPAKGVVAGSRLV
jgi:hypothetical protein